MSSDDSWSAQEDLQTTPRMGKALLTSRKLNFSDMYDSDFDKSYNEEDDITVLESKKEEDDVQEGFSVTIPAHEEPDLGYVADSEEGLEDEEDTEDTGEWDTQEGGQHYRGKAGSAPSRKRKIEPEDNDCWREEAQIISIAIPGQRLPKRRCLSPSKGGKTALPLCCLQSDNTPNSPREVKLCEIGPQEGDLLQFSAQTDISQQPHTPEGQPSTITAATSDTSHQLEIPIETLFSESQYNKAKLDLPTHRGEIYSLLDDIFGEEEITIFGEEEITTQQKDGLQRK